LLLALTTFLACDIELSETSESLMVSVSGHFHSWYGIVVATVLQDVCLPEDFEGVVVDVEKSYNVSSRRRLVSAFISNHAFSHGVAGIVEG